MATMKTGGTLSDMFISDVNRSRQAAFETTMADFESLIFNDTVAAALADGPVTAEEYRGLFDRFIPAIVKHRVISIDRASIRAGKIGIAFLTDDEASGYNIHPTLASSMLPEQHAALVDKGLDRLERTVIKIMAMVDTTIAHLLDPHNSSGYKGLYRVLERSSDATTVSGCAFLASHFNDTSSFIRWLYPTIVTRIATAKDYSMGDIIVHESTHVMQACRPGTKVPFDDDEAFHNATAIYDEFEAYFVTTKALLASGENVEDIPRKIYDFFTASRLPLQNSYTNIGAYGDIMDIIENHNTSGIEWVGGKVAVPYYRYIPNILSARLKEIASALLRNVNSTSCS